MYCNWKGSVLLDNLSTFPSEVDQFPRLYDLPASLALKAKRYQELKMMSVLDANDQAELNSLVIDLGDYIITPRTMNKFADGMVNLQEFFLKKVDGYIDEKQIEWDGYIRSFQWIEVYNPNSTYKMQNMVTYFGDLYLCTAKTSKGVPPNNLANWQKISSKGDKGDVGLNTHLKGNYSSTFSYKIGDAVRFDETIYYCIKDSVGISPENPEYWMIYDKQFVGKNPPASTQENLIWIELLD